MKNWGDAMRGLTGGLLRLSVGIEDGDDLIADLDQAFSSIRSGAPIRVTANT